MPETLYEYYLDRKILPTFGSFQARADLEAYERERRGLFTDKLFLPPRLFQNAQLIEFGPDAGENSLVFALWGALCSLVEPNSEAHPVIKNYFKRFELLHKLVSLESLDLKAFSLLPDPLPKFDIIDAEGFIYTVKPESLWIDLFSRLLNPDGFVILFYYEAFGSFIELLQKVIHAKVCQVTGMNSFDGASKLFAAKWDSIPHKRPMKAWVMDVLENPFVRQSYCFEPLQLCSMMHDSGFDLYSSYPPYRDNFTVHWFKKNLTAEERMHLQRDFITRSRLSHLFGRKLFLLRPSDALEDTLKNLLTSSDSLIDKFNNDLAAQCSEYLAELANLIGSDAVWSEAKDSFYTLQAIRSFQHILHLLSHEAIDELITFCNKDELFISSWGMPSHFAVFRKRA